MSAASHFTLITGASSGIGEALAHRLAPTRRLILSGRSSERLDAVAAKNAASGPHLVWPFDLSDPAAIVDTLAAFLTEHAASVEAFVHCAGAVKVLPMRDVDAQTAAEMMNVNCLSAAQIVRALLRKSINHGALANVVFISSTYAIRGAKGHAVYSATKGALDAMVRSLALELAPAVRVNSVVAGGVPTRMAQGVFGDPEQLARSRERYPLRLGEVADLVDAVEFLLSEKASWISGTGLVVDGGASAL